ncbi:four helix bundle protein [Teredinibacter turnerae]|uniref:four helix bundle protein n=1 Tax=Teredinibacter turnerae TaxID=2426 RepID=UPI0004186D84|nr:four helix bundle protein [Teredinibacter turnerae]
MKFKKLDVWKESERLCVEVYKNLGTLRDYSFRDQITRSALSIPSNIAEGEERESLKDSIRFLNIAKGSTAELITQLYIGGEIGFEEEELGKFGALRFWERFALLRFWSAAGGGCWERASPCWGGGAFGFVMI